MINIYKTILFISFISNIALCQADIDNAVKYTLQLSRTLVHPEEVTTLMADLKMSENYFVYSSHPKKSLSPSYIEWQDSSSFSVVGILNEPKPKTKYDPMFEMDISYHTDKVQFSQDLKIADTHIKTKIVFNSPIKIKIRDSDKSKSEIEKLNPINKML